MIFGIFKDYKKIAAEGINNEFKAFEKLLKNKKGNVTPEIFKKEYSKKLFFRNVKCDLGLRDFGYEFAFSVHDDHVPFWFYGWFKKGNIDSFEFSCIDERFYNIEGYINLRDNSRSIAVINKGGLGMYGGSKALKKLLIKNYGFEDEKGGFVDQGKHL